MVNEWLANLKPYLIGQQALTSEVLAEALNRASRLNSRSIEYARSLIGDHTYFLSDYNLRALIRDEINIEDGKRLAESRRSIFRRMAELLPTILTYIDISADDNIRYAVQIITDTCFDYEIAKNLPRRDKSSRVARLKLANALDAVKRAKAALEDARDHIDFEFSDALEAMKGTEAADFRNSTFDDLLEQLGLLATVAEYQEADLRRSYPRSRVFGRGGKSDLVECAYDLHRECSGPPLSTTPGSDFSLICGYLFEIVSGIPDEGLAGAINRFANSNARREKDEYHVELQADDEAIDSNDNFHGTRTRSKYYEERVAELVRLKGEVTVSPEAVTVISRQIDYLSAKAAMHSNRLGPHIVWADQDPRFKDAAEPETDNKLYEDIEELDFLIGQYRRHLRALGIDPNLVESGKIHVNSPEAI